MRGRQRGQKQRQYDNENELQAFHGGRRYGFLFFGYSKIKNLLSNK